MSTRLFALLIAMHLGACRRDITSGGGGAEKPIDVASVIAGCDDLDGCDRQCADANPNACVSSGRMYEFGHGVTVDPSRAFRLYERACDLKSAGGCYNAAVLLESGKGVDRNLSVARQLYAKVCDMGSKTSCERARRLGDGGSE